jgi:hypothetical protein
MSPIFERCSRYLHNREISQVAASTGSKMIALETSPVRIASFRLTVLLGMVVGSMTATKTMPKISGMTRPVTAAVRCMVTTKAMIRPILKRSVS